MRLYISFLLDNVHASRNRSTYSSYIVDLMLGYTQEVSVRLYRDKYLSVGQIRITVRTVQKNRRPQVIHNWNRK